MRQKEGRQLRLEAERAAFQKAKRKRNFIRWGVVLAIFVVAVFLWWLINRDDSDDQVAVDQTEQPTPTVPQTVPQSDPATEGTDPITDPESEGTDSPENTPTTRQEDIMPPSYTTFTDSDYGATPCPAEGSERQLSFDDSFQNCLEPGTAYTAVMDTTLGEVRIALDTQNTPGTSNNFISLSRAGYYDGTLLHRTDTSIGIIQGGSPHTNNAADPGPGYNIKDEGTDFTYRPGQLVMARGQGLNSAGAQFFFAVNSQTALLDSQGIYVVFGEVTEGLDVLEAVLASHRDNPASRLGGAPDPDVTLRSVTIETAEQSSTTTDPPTATAAPTTVNPTTSVAN